MPVCPACGIANVSVEVCTHHVSSPADDWAAGNRIMCDFVHRGIVPPRLPEAERDDDFWTAVGETAPSVEDAA